jgi:predicted DCC family thiol-disulfide oxidoreductase YuxK
MHHLTVLFDAGCPLCLRCRHWLADQPKYVPMRFVAQGTAEAGERFPQLDIGEGKSVRDLIVVADDGRVYRNDAAWIMCFWALRQYRPLAMRLSHPALRPLARRAYAAISRNRLKVGRLLGHHTLARQIREATPDRAACDAPTGPPRRVAGAAPWAEHARQRQDHAVARARRDGC